MGMTVTYTIKATPRSKASAQRLLEDIRRMAMDLPFEEVGEISDISGDVLQKSYDELRNNGPLWTVMDTERHFLLPWTRLEHKYPGNSRTIRQQTHTVRPLEVMSFDTLPADGGESATFGLASYPTTFTAIWKPRDDRRFQRKYVTSHGVDWHFDHNKWSQYCMRRVGRYESCDVHEERKMKTRMGGWYYSAFCKTEPSSREEYGGVANFVRGHISLITLLDQIAKLTGLKIDYNDEAHYGQSEYTDDPSANPPVYTMHPGRYSVTHLAHQVGGKEVLERDFGDAVEDANKSMERDGYVSIDARCKLLRALAKDHAQWRLRGILETQTTA